MNARRVVVVTGATGFIGRRLCEHLAPHADVRALARRVESSGPWQRALALDLAREAPPVEFFSGADVVFHFAGRAHAMESGDDALHHAVNTEGTRRVLETAAAAGVARVVYASSVKAMGEGDGRAGDAPVGAYGVSKRAAEELVLSGNFVREPVVLRPALVYGPGAGGNLAAWIDAIRAHRFPPPPRVQNRRALVHVDDVVAAAIAAARADAAVGQALVVGDGVPYSTRDLYDAIVRALGRSPTRFAVPTACFQVLALAGEGLERATGRRAPFDREAYRKLFGSAWYDAGDTRARLAWEPRFTLPEALPAMVQRG